MYVKFKNGNEYTEKESINLEKKIKSFFGINVKCPHPIRVNISGDFKKYIYKSWIFLFSRFELTLPVLFSW